MITNLDELQEPKRTVIFLKKNYTLNYIPAGIAFVLTERFKQLASFATVPVETLSKEEIKEVLRRKLELVAIFTSHQFPQVDLEYIERTANVLQVNEFVSELSKTILLRLKPYLTQTRKP